MQSNLHMWGCMLIFIILHIGNAAAQTSAGITFLRDNSYTTASAFAAIRLAHPESTIVSMSATPEVVQDDDLIYATIGQRNLRTAVFYHRQKASHKRTAIIFLHGGGWRSGSPDQHHPLAQKLALLGYICFTPEYRLSGEARFPAAVHDIKAMIRWVRAHADDYHIDHDKIVIGGFSAGAELAAFVGTTDGIAKYSGLSTKEVDPAHVNAVLNIDGIVSFDHPESGEGDDRQKLSAATLWLGDGKKNDPIRWKSASPLHYAGSTTPPTLFINSSIPRMHAGRDDYIRILSQHQIYTEVHTFPNAPHPFCLFEPWQTPTINIIDNDSQITISSITDGTEGGANAGAALGRRRQRRRPRWRRRIW